MDSLVRVPATSANLAAGFDSLGLAVGLYNSVKVELASSTEIVVQGEGSYLIKPENNLLYRAMQLYFDNKGLKLPELRIVQDNMIPVKRGLGSSSAAIVAGLAIAQYLDKGYLKKDELWPLALQLEQHPDNLAAALFGGLTIVAGGAGIPPVLSLSRVDLPVLEKIQGLMVVPEKKISTSRARNALKKTISRDDAVFNISRAALLIGALNVGRVDLLKEALQDRLHQPHRFKLIPWASNLAEEVLAVGALGSYISGSGSTYAVLVERENAKGIQQYIEELMNSWQVKASVIDVDLAVSGVELIKGE